MPLTIINVEGLTEMTIHFSIFDMLIKYIHLLIFVDLISACYLHSQSTSSNNGE